MLCGLCFSKRQTAKSTQQHPGELFNNPAQLPPLSRAVRPRKGCQNSGRMASPTTFFNQEQDLAPGSATEPSSSAKELSLNYAPTSASPLFFAKVPLLDRVRATLAEDSMSFAISASVLQWETSPCFCFLSLTLYSAVVASNSHFDPGKLIA